MGHKQFDETLRYAKLFDNKVRESYNTAMEKMTAKKTAKMQENPGGLHEAI